MSWCAELFELPCIAYARSTLEIAPLVGAGADFIALDFIWQSSGDVKQALREAAAELRAPEAVR